VVLSSLMVLALWFCDGIRDAGILHLFPRLCAPTHGHFRIGVPGVGRRVVVMRSRLKPRAFWRCQRSGENVIGLPCGFGNSGCRSLTLNQIERPDDLRLADSARRSLSDTHKWRKLNTILAGKVDALRRRSGNEGGDEGGAAFRD
jgi:hypothetical protein